MHQIKEPQDESSILNYTEILSFLPPSNSSLLSSVTTYFLSFCLPTYLPTGKVIHSMVAHLDAVTCLTTDPKGSYLISGSEYKTHASYSYRLFITRSLKHAV